MRRRFVPCAVLLASLVGCSQKDAATSPSGGPGPGEPANPNATYMLTFRAAEKGDRTEVVKARDATAVVKTADSSTTQRDNFRYEYTETVLDTAPGEPRPTKVTRVYRTARKVDPRGETRNASYVGKTVTIEKYLQGYKYTVDGGSLPPAEQVEVNQDFTTAQWRLDQTLPKTPVKVGEEWAVDFSAITALAGKAQADYSKDKSKITGKLVRVYQKDGRRWGVIEVKVRMVMDVATGGSPVKGEVDTDVTFDVVIDGSARSGSMKVVLNGTVNGRDPAGRDTSTTIKGTEERSLTPVK